MTVKARPILFSAPMVRALIAGTKTQTRRVCKPAMEQALSYVATIPGADAWGDEEGLGTTFYCPYGKPGDLLWVREAWAVKRHEPCLAHERDYQELISPTIRFLADRECRKIDGNRTSGLGIYRGPVEKGRPSIHMPRWASRLTLRITDVRVQRLQNISEFDSVSEGVETRHPCVQSVIDFGRLWVEINGPDSWTANPWIWALTFEVLHANVDRVLEQAAA